MDLAAVDLHMNYAYNHFVTTEAELRCFVGGTVQHIGLPTHKKTKVFYSFCTTAICKKKKKNQIEFILTKSCNAYYICLNIALKLINQKGNAVYVMKHLTSFYIFVNVNKLLLWKRYKEPTRPVL